MVTPREASRGGAVGEEVGDGLCTRVSVGEWIWAMKSKENVSWSQHEGLVYVQKVAMNVTVMEKGGSANIKALWRGW